MADGQRLYPGLYSGFECRWKGCGGPTLDGEVYCLAHKEQVFNHLLSGGCRHIGDDGTTCIRHVYAGKAFCCVHEPKAAELFPLGNVVTLPPEEKEDILDEAKRITSTDRNRDYGHPLDNFQQTADMLTAFFFRKLKPGCRIEPREIPWVNILQKASRDSNAPKRDNLVDTAGYARTAQMVEDEQARRAVTPDLARLAEDGNPNHA